MKRKLFTFLVGIVLSVCAVQKVFAVDVYIVELYKVLTGKDKNKFDFVDEDFQLLQNYMLTIINDEDSRY